MRWLPVAFFLSSCALVLAAILSIPAVVDIMRGDDEPYRVTIQAPPMTRTHHQLQRRDLRQINMTGCGRDPRRMVDEQSSYQVDPVNCPSCIVALLAEGSPELTTEQLGTLAARALSARDSVPASTSSRRHGHVDVYRAGRWRVSVHQTRTTVRITIRRWRGLEVREEYFSESHTIAQAQRRLGAWMLATRTEALR